jgi:hypothetical protein
VQWPQADGRSGARSSRRTERLLKAAVVLCLLALTVFDRFGLRFTDTYSIPPALVAVYVLAGVMLVAGAAELNVRGALAYLAVASVAVLSFLVNSNFGAQQYVSMASLMLLMAVYAPFAVSLRPSAAAPALWAWIVKTYIVFALVLAAAGIAQFLLQFVWRPPWLFDYTPLIPAPLRASGSWNTVISTGDWIKSNGFFLREPSIFSLKIALALLLELGSTRRKWAMALLAAALVLTYSGSGLVVLGVALLFPFGGRSLLQLAVAVTLAVILFSLPGDPLNLSYTVGRAEEFQQDRSSAACRFILPGRVVARDIDKHGWASLLGHGPGTMTKMHNTCEPTYSKILFEYGLLGALAFGVLMWGALGRAPLRVRVAVALEWLLLGALLAPDILLVIYLLSGMWPQAASARPGAA